MSTISAGYLSKCQDTRVGRSDGSDVSGALQSTLTMDTQPLGAHANAAEVLEAANSPARSAQRSRLMKGIKATCNGGWGASRLS